MAKSVGMARLAYRRFWSLSEDSCCWAWESRAFAIARHATRYLRHHAQRRTT